ncbi:hypothetical protein [Lysobacter sp. A3-1-A15]|uniref:hypothetical protein n=1 Tax=Novilysobacter viscosus TaxID=3098602 RepID=UPI002EDA1FB0
MPVPRPLRRLFRTALLTLLVLGMAVGPALGAVGQLHSAAHEQPEFGHGHAHDHEGGHDGPLLQSAGNHPHPAGELDHGDHATGSHGLMHQASTVSFAMPHTAMEIPMPAACSTHLPELAGTHLPGDSPSLPFRPPIA